MSEPLFPPYFVEVSLACALLAAPISAWSASLVHQADASSAELAGDVVADDAGLGGKDEANEGQDAHDEPAVIEEQTFGHKRLAHDIVITGVAHEVDKADLKAFRKRAAAFEKTGRRLAVVIVDLESGAELSYNADEPFYPASSIKGPYVVSLFQGTAAKRSGSVKQVWSLAKPTIVESDNEAYLELCDLCDGRAFASWAADAGAVKKGSDDYRRFAHEHYPDLTAHQLALLWEHAYPYLTGDSKRARKLLKLFERRNESPLREGLDDDCHTITKAGWYPLDDGDEYAATVDAGIVEEGSHTYVVAIMTDAPAELDTLTNLVGDLFSAHIVLDEP